MPLLPGKGEVGHNIKELEEAGHERKQSIAIALKEAGLSNKDAPFAPANPGMTLADIQRKNDALWMGKAGDKPMRDERERPTLPPTPAAEMHKDEEMVSGTDESDPVLVGAEGLTPAAINERNKQYWEPEKQVSEETSDKK